MENTLLIGDHVLVDRVNLAPPAHWAPFVRYRTVHRGDVIVFLKPGYPDMFLVKRVVGIPGDRVHLHEGYVYLNGKRQDEPQAGHPDYSTYLPYRDEFPNVPTSQGQDIEPTWANELPSHIQNGDLVVPPGNYFAMGDNRLNSLDGRYWGFVPARKHRRPAALRLLVLHLAGRRRRARQHERSHAAVRARAAPLLRSDTLAQDLPHGALKHFSCDGARYTWRGLFRQRAHVLRGPVPLQENA